MRTILAITASLILTATASAGDRSLAGFKTTVSEADVWVVTSTCETRIQGDDSYARVCDAHTMSEGMITPDVVRVACAPNAQGFVECADDGATVAPPRAE